MIESMHEWIEWQQREDGMHCLGWICRKCRGVQMGECHHQSWCREDFCGAAPVVEVAPASRYGPVLSTTG